MNKKYFLLILLTLVLALFLCACQDNPTDPKVDPPVEEIGWTDISSPTPADAYKRMLSGFTSIASDFSKSTLKSSPKVSVTSKLKLTINGNTFWLAINANYDNSRPEKLMLALELTTEEDSYSNLVLGAYICNERLNIALGETKFSFAFESSLWKDYFPYEMSMESSSDIEKLSLLLAGTIDLENKSIVGKTRMNGTIEEYNYAFKVNLPSSLKKIFEYLKKNTDTIKVEDLEKYGTIIENLFGVSIDDITQGKFPSSTVDMNFTTANKKLSAMIIDLKIDTSNVENTVLFAGDDLEMNIELVNYTSSKTQNVPIDFVTNVDKQNEYVNYINNAFKVSLDTEKVLSDSTKKHYKLNFTAKVFQENPLDNYLFIEFKNKSTSIVEHALYIYQNIAYLYKDVGGAFTCLYSYPLDLNDIATRVVNNNLKETNASKLNWLNLIAYLLGAVRINDERIKFGITEKFYSAVLYNFYDLCDYVNSLFVEDKEQIPEFVDFYSFIINDDATITMKYSEPFVSLLSDTDTELTNIILMLSSAESQNTLTPVPVIEE